MSTQTQPPAPWGMELRLAAVPINVSAHRLKTVLVGEYLKGIKYDFEVVLQASSEKQFWKKFDESKTVYTTTARVVIPNDSKNHNLGTALIGKTIVIPYGYHGLRTIHITEIKDPATLDSRYKKLRAANFNLPPVDGLTNGTIGLIHNVSCGMFARARMKNIFEKVNDDKSDHEDTFATTYTWKFGKENRFRDFSYFGDLLPTKFRVCLTESQKGEPLSLEWMDLHEPNIRGVVFEKPRDADQNRRVVYFVLDKPPQFYRRTRKEYITEPEMSSKDALRNDEARPADLRIPYPSMSHDPEHSPDSFEELGIPWAIQYSRVFRLEYEKIEIFKFETLRPRLSEAQKKILYAFEHPRFETSSWKYSEMQETLRSNISGIRNLFGQSFFGSQVAVLKLFYNCNLCGFLTESVPSLDRDIASELKKLEPTRSQYRLYNESFNKMARVLGSYQLRCLHRLYNGLAPNVPRLPLVEAKTGLDPDIAFQEVFRTNYWDKEAKRGNENISPGVFELLIYPSHIELEGPVDPSRNSITDRYKASIEHFLRVRFVDNNGRILRAESDISLDTIVQERVVWLLDSKVQPLHPILGEHRRPPPSREVDLFGTFEFLGYTMSSLKKKKMVWLFSRKSDYGARDIRDQIGRWDESNASLAKKPSKWGARISLAFTESIPVCELNQSQWKTRPDHPDETETEFANTDGCGLISREFCETINNALAPLSIPTLRAFQIRLSGIKGVVYAGADSLFEEHGKGLKMLLRKSQIKVEVRDTSKLELRVVPEGSDGDPSLFFDSALKAFEDSGADASKILSIFEDTYRDMSIVTSNGLDVLRQIFRLPNDDRDVSVKAKYCLLKLAIYLKRADIGPEVYHNSFLAHYLAKLADRARGKDLFAIPIPGSYRVLGVTDDYQVLDPGQVFIRANGKIINGPVLIYRDPIIHIGDIQEAKAVDEKAIETQMQSLNHKDIGDRLAALLEMDNVIFFSQKDRPPLPNCLSGGDLDGDRFEVVTKACGFWVEKYKISGSDNYAGPVGASQPKGHTGFTQNLIATQPPHNEMKSFDITELTKFIGNYVRNDCFWELQDILMCLADQTEHGLKDDVVKRLAKSLSDAVDYPKNGKEVNLARDVFANPDYVVKRKPDFVSALGRKVYHDANGEVYRSKKLLGKIYQTISNMKFTLAERAEEDTDDFDLWNMLREHWLEDSGNIQDSKLNRHVNELFYAIEDMTRLEWDRYDNYRDENRLYVDTELDLFMRKKDDDFPFNFINDLVLRTLKELERQEMLRIVDVHHSPPTVRLGTTYDYKTVDRIYKICLHSAW